jgi:SAM-dependent methyltransferase
MTASGLFAGKAEQYVRYRTDYPEGLIRSALAAIELRTVDVVADLGSGTGLLARWILERGNLVLGVEPDQGMRTMARHLLATYQNFLSVAGSAEATTLAESSVDVITVGNAFHYFDAAQARAEAMRILRPGGRALIFGHAKAGAPNLFMLEYGRFLEGIASREQWEFHQAARDTASLRVFFNGSPVYESDLGPVSYPFSWEQLSGRFLSTSLAPPEGDARRQAVLAGLRQIFEDFARDGTVEFQLQWGYRWGTLKASP